MNIEASKQILRADAAQSGDASSAPSREPNTRAARPLPEDALIILPVRNLVLFPGVVLPITIGRTKSRAAAQEAARLQRPIGVLLQNKPDIDDPKSEDLHWIGTAANVLRYVTGPDGAHHVVAQGEERFRVLQFLDGYDFPVARVLRIPNVETTDTEIEARALTLKQRAVEILHLLPQVPEEMVAALQRLEGASQLADLVAGLMDATPEEKQVLLETFDLRERLDKLLEHLSKRLEVLKLSREIDERTKESMESKSREHLLRERMAAIQKELGDDDEGKAEFAELEKAIAEAGMPEEVEKQARKELKRLERMPEAAGEYSMVRTYLEWLTELPWKDPDGSAIEIAEARRILDADHYGLDKIKRRILEYLAVRKLNPSGKSPILCFVGPPGVGKTSLGQSIARATGREFVRVSLGGVHDEAEIRGHRRTYIGALPGNIIQSVRKAGTKQAVMMLDEVDKLGGGAFHGDPSSALLEVLDPEQNSTFRDNYLAVPYDLSKVMFVCTANVLDTIPGPLRDRMEIIQLAGYTEQEKLEIAKRYLLDRQLSANGLTRSQCEITEDALRAIVTDYTREAGVRNLEREIGSVLRHVAVRIAEGTITQAKIEPQDLHEILGPRKFESEVAMRTSVPGVATGLAWTPVGGDILFIEATRMHGSGQVDPHGSARRRDEGERAGGALAREIARGAARDRSRAPREVGHPRARACGRDAEGWPERGCRDVSRARLSAHAAAGAQRHRDDGRDQPARPRAADRRREGEGARRHARRASRGSCCRSATARNSRKFRRKCARSSSSCGSTRWTTPLPRRSRKSRTGWRRTPSRHSTSSRRCVARTRSRHGSTAAGFRSSPE